MLEMKLFRKLKIRAAFHKIYSNRCKINESSQFQEIPIAHYDKLILSISRKGFNVSIQKEDEQTDLQSLKHLPLTNRHYLITREDYSRYFAFPKLKVKEICDLFPELDAKRMKDHFYKGIGYRKR